MWPGHKATRGLCDDFFYYALRQHYIVTLDDQNPDIVISSVFGTALEGKLFPNNPLIVGYSGESTDYEGECDIKFGFHAPSDPNYHRLPLWCLYIDWDTQKVSSNPLHISHLLCRHQRAPAIAERFCNFTYKNPVRDRVEFFLKLNTVNKIDSTGPLYNNSGYLLGSKVNELNKWKFTIAWENTLMPGYVTEKLLEPLAAGSIPIYHGGHLSKLDFNPQCFISVNDWTDQSALIQYINDLSRDSNKLLEILSQPVFIEPINWPEHIFQLIYTKLEAKTPHLAI